jgi:hypothetical protein
MFGHVPIALLPAAAPADEFALNYRPDKHLFHLKISGPIFRNWNVIVAISRCFR